MRISDWSSDVCSSDLQKHILPLPGSREGLFFAVVAAAQAYKGAQPPVVLLPNPFYHVYASSALAVGAEPVFVPATADTGFMPDYAALDAPLLDRAGSEERRVGKECVSTCRSRWSPSH